MPLLCAFPYCGRTVSVVSSFCEEHERNMDLSGYSYTTFPTVIAHVEFVSRDCISITHTNHEFCKKSWGYVVTYQPLRSEKSEKSIVGEFDTLKEAVHDFSRRKLND